MKKSLRLKRITAALMCCITTCLTAINAFAAGNIAGSAVGVGVTNLINDVTNWLLVIAPVVGGVCIVFFCIRRSAADEMDQKKWNNRIVTAAVSTIGAVLGVALMNLILGYFTTTPAAV